MSTASRDGRHVEHGADPWWGDSIPAVTVAAPGTSADAARASRRRRGSRSGRSGAGWFLLGVLVAPIDWTRRSVARSPRLQRVFVRLVVLLAVGIMLASSVGVILINNVVIGRTAELGELDDRRRELRRDNALLSAEAARLSAPSVVFGRASDELGMVRTPELPRFIYLEPGSRTLTPLQRRRVAARDARLRARAERLAAARSAPRPTVAEEAVTAPEESTP